jgi:hypothetical protein
MKQIKDYLHLYLGCYAIAPTGTRVYVEGVFWRDCDLYAKILIQDRNSDINGVDGNCPAYNLKPILLPLSSMTIEEAKAHLNFNCMETKGAITDVYEVAAAQTKYLLSKQFDLFGLIDDGLAVDATQISNRVIKPD